MVDTKKKASKTMSEKNIEENNVDEAESKYFMEFFQKSSSNEVNDRIISHTENIPDEFVMETHLKIMHTIIIPYLHR